MITDEQFTKLRAVLPMLRSASPQHLEEFKRSASLVRIPAGQDIFNEGDDVSAIALLVSGVVRVYKIGESGREITLYRFGLGESCILTATAILARQTFTAIATVEQDAEAVMIPAATFDEWVQRHHLWRDFLFTLLSQRLANVMELVEEVTFRRMDIRIASFLLERSRTQLVINITHQEIAAELGSSREVVSRILENLAEKGVLRARRGAVEILDAALLQSMCAG